MKYNLDKKKLEEGFHELMKQHVNRTYEEMSLVISKFKESENAMGYYGRISCPEEVKEDLSGILLLELESAKTKEIPPQILKKYSGEMINDLKNAESDLEKFMFERRRKI